MYFPNQGGLCRLFGGIVFGKQIDFFLFKMHISNVELGKDVEVGKGRFFLEIPVCQWTSFVSGGSSFWPKWVDLLGPFDPRSIIFQRKTNKQ